MDKDTLNKAFTTFDKTHSAFEKTSGRITKAFVALWVTAAVLSLALTGTVIWAIYKLVIHFTAG